MNKYHKDWFCHSKVDREGIHILYMQIAYFHFLNKGYRLLQREKEKAGIKNKKRGGCQGLMLVQETQALA